MGLTMSESYVEVLVKREKTFLSTFLRTLCIVLIVIAVLLTMLGGGLTFLLVAIGLGVVAYFLWMNTEIEYEYLYLDKELVIDKVMSRTKRKRVHTYNIERMEILAPSTSHQLDSYNHRTFKVVDYSSGSKQNTQRYIMIYDGTTKVILESNLELAKVIRTIAPRKVFLD